MTEDVEYKEYTALPDGGSKGIVKVKGKLYRFDIRRLRRKKSKPEKRKYR